MISVKSGSLVLVLALVAAGCDKLPLLAPQQSTITLSTASNIVQANGATEIRATVLEQGGTPVQNGTTVTFTTNLGSITPEARTTNGVAVAQFVGNGQSGTASVKAISGGAASDALEISVGAAAANRVSLTASPTNVPATGGSTTITAIVTDASGNPLGGVPVSFNTTAGSFSATVVNTDSAGIARTTLTTNREATVTATSGSTTSANLTVTTTARPTVTIALATGSAPPSEGGITTFTVTVTPATTGGEPIQNVVIDYGDGTSDNLGVVTGTFPVQHVYGDDGSFAPRVTVTDTNGASVSASTVIVVQPVVVTVTTASTSNPFSFTASVSPSTGVTIVSYTWTFGDGTSATTTGNSVQHTYATSGQKTVRATARTSTGHTSTGSTVISVP